MKTHWFCTHLTRQVGDAHDRALRYMGMVFERADVRLVLDVGGSIGVFASALHKRYGDRIVCITGDVITTLSKDVYYKEKARGLVWPSLQILAAKGMPGIIIDAMSYLPFGESTLDALHTSWVYHSGFPPRTLWEFYRVLRPGGFLIIRMQWQTHMSYHTMRNSSQHAWGNLYKWAASMGMRKVSYVSNPGLGHGSLMILQMPVSPEWEDYQVSAGNATGQR